MVLLYKSREINVDSLRPFASWQPGHWKRGEQNSAGTASPKSLVLDFSFTLAFSSFFFSQQDYGPKVNFKKQRLKAGSFTGLPSFSRKIVAQMKACAVLSGFLPVEQCNLDYRPERGSAIDPHFDDWWLWGERLVSLNLLSKTVLSMSCDSEDTIQLFPISSKEELSPPASFMQTSACRSPGEEGTECFLSPRLVRGKEVSVAILLPQRSLVVLHGDARYKWKHGIHRRHIQHRRVCITFRELSAEFSAGGRHEELGKELLQIALSFQGRPV